MALVESINALIRTKDDNKKVFDLIARSNITYSENIKKCLHTAVVHSNYEVVYKLIIEYRMCVRSIFDGKTTLMNCFDNFHKPKNFEEYKEKIRIVELLITNRADITKDKDEEYNTVLIMASIMHYFEIVKLLLDSKKNLDINFENKHNNCALVYLLGYSSFDSWLKRDYEGLEDLILQIIRLPHVNINARCGTGGSIGFSRGNSLFDMACSRRMYRVANEIISNKKFNINYCSHNSTHPLVTACNFDNFNLAQKIIERPDFDMFYVDTFSNSLVSLITKKNTYTGIQLAIRFVNQDEKLLNTINVKGETILFMSGTKFNIYIEDKYNEEFKKLSYIVTYEEKNILIEILKKTNSCEIEVFMELMYLATKLVCDEKFSIDNFINSSHHYNVICDICTRINKFYKNRMVNASNACNEYIKLLINILSRKNIYVSDKSRGTIQTVIKLLRNNEHNNQERVDLINALNEKSNFI